MNAAATPAPALGTDVDAGTPSIPVDAPQDEEPRLIAGELHAELTKHLQDAFKITSLACVPMTRADIDQRGAPAMGDPAALAAAIATVYRNATERAVRSDPLRRQRCDATERTCS